MQGEEEQVDDAFLAEVMGFLDQCNALEDTADTKQEAPTTTSDDGLLLTSHQLLAETKELLASCDTKPDVRNHKDDDSSSSAAGVSSEDGISQENAPISAEKRREIRNAQAAQRRLRYRQKLKGEKETLKYQASELASQLTTLQAAQAELKARQAGSLTLGAWRAIAARQMEKRMQAEQQQKFLRAEVIGRSRLFHQMNLLLQEKLQTTQPERLISCEYMATTSTSAGSALLESMLSELDEYYSRTDAVLSGLDFKMSVPAAYSLTRKWNQGVMYFDSSDRMVFPYDFEQASDPISIAMMSDPDSDFATVNVEDLKNSLTMRCELKYQPSNGEIARFVSYGTAKRYREKDRLVFLWRSFTEGLGDFEDCQCDETMWVVIRPASENDGIKCGESCTVMDSYARLVPVKFGGTAECEESINRFVKILAEAGKHEVKQMMEMMETLMINSL